MSYKNLAEFYRSKEWEEFRRIVILDRMKDGVLYDEITGKPIVKKYDVILHHIEHLTEENVKDASIALNPDNIQIVSFATHNGLHKRNGYKRKEVFIVYGSPLSGKTTWVNENKVEGDLVVDIDNIWQCVTGAKRYEKPNGLKSVVFGVRDNLYEAVKYRRGYWQNAYIIGGFALSSERERLIKEMGAREVYIDTTKEECLKRLEADTERDAEEWRKYIENWWRLYQ